MNNSAAAATSSSGGSGSCGGSSGSYDGTAILPSTSERTTTSVSSADASSVTSSTSSPLSSKAVTKSQTSSAGAQPPPTTSDIAAMNTTTGSVGSNTSTQAGAGGTVAPQNPFDQIENYNNAPRSPDRSTSSSTYEAPGSPLDLSTPSLSSAPTTPILGGDGSMRTAPALPLSAPPHTRSAGPPLAPFVDHNPQQQPQHQPQQPAQRQQPQTEQQRNATTANAKNNNNNSRQNTPPSMYNSAPSQHRGGAPIVSHATPMPQPIFDDDENTEPSSEAPNNSSYPNVPDASLAGSFARFLEHTRMRFGHNDSEYPNRQPASSDDDENNMQGKTGALICGYLQKLGRNGKWQTRWFETDGECLTYFKSSKRKKPLATLDLEKVGAIEIDPDDVKGCSFSIQVMGRLYHLRASSRASCKDWVITLNRVKEARMNQGNVKLVSQKDYLLAQQQQQTQPHHHHHAQEPMIDLLDHQPREDMVTPRVVVVANRQRTRAVDESQEWDQLMGSSKQPQQTHIGPYDHHSKRRSTLGNVVLARWTKQRPALSRLGAKLAKWARSLRKLRCQEIERGYVVQLDHHVHPPGHDDYVKRAAARRHKNRSNQNAAGKVGLSGWIGKETRQSAGATPSSDEDDDGGIVESAGVNSQPIDNKPNRTIRAFSNASEDEARMIS